MKTMGKRSVVMSNLALTLLALIVGHYPSSVVGQLSSASASAAASAGASSLGNGNIYGFGGNSGGGLLSPLTQAIPNVVSGVSNLLTGSPLRAGTSSSAGAVGRIGAALSGRSGPADHLVSNGFGLGTGTVNGLVTGLAAASGSVGLTSATNSLTNAVQGVGNNLFSGIANGGLGGGLGRGLGAAVGGAISSAGASTAVDSGIVGGIAQTGAAALGAASSGLGGLGSGMLGSGMMGQGILGQGMLAQGLSGAGALLGAGSGLGSAGTAVAAAAGAAAAGGGAAASGMAGALGGAAGHLGAANAAISAAGAGALSEAAALPAAMAGLGSELAMGNYAAGRLGLAASAAGNAEAESAIAGADMAAHSANNARSASLASNAYRQAKLASARDRVNIAGTVQNSARISDAAIATHDASIKAEDSLLGSELAVDSAATVLDSDAAYIPPVTNSLLRSLPYGRLALRNILPKPLAFPSHLQPDLWLNGAPVNYRNIPLRTPPLGFLGAQNPILPNLLPFRGLSGFFPNNGQPFTSNNGIYLNSLYVDPALAYARIGGVIGSSILPILANGQLQAQDELALANAIINSQLMGPGMSATYTGYGSINSVPFLTGSVTEINLAPTTTAGTTYPIGSALVIEPRDSYFQDHIDSASSRQNWDERQQ